MTSGSESGRTREQLRSAVYLIVRTVTVSPWRKLLVGYLTVFAFETLPKAAST